MFLTGSVLPWILGGAALWAGVIALVAALCVAAARGDAEAKGTWPQLGGGPQTFKDLAELAIGSTDAAHATVFTPGRRRGGLMVAATATDPTAPDPPVIHRELADACLLSGTLVATAPGRTRDRADHPLAVGAALPLWHEGNRSGALVLSWPVPGHALSGRKHETLTTLAIAAERLMGVRLGRLQDASPGGGRFVPGNVPHSHPETTATHARTLE
jgi:hypothetical protein